MSRRISSCRGVRGCRASGFCDREKPSTTFWRTAAVIYWPPSMTWAIAQTKHGYRHERDRGRLRELCELVSSLRYCKAGMDVRRQIGFKLSDLKRLRSAPVLLSATGSALLAPIRLSQ